MSPIQRVNILGVGVSAINMEMACSIIDQRIQEKAHCYLTATGVHGVIESQRDEQIRQIHNQAGLVMPDGMPLVWLSKLNGFKYAGRVYGPDLTLAVCEQSLTRKYRHFFYGSSPETLQRLHDNLLARFSGLEIVGTYSPPFRSLTEQEDQEIIKVINATDADIVWVGLSTPKQERWMSDHLGKINAPVMIGVGAAFDFHAGVKQQAPRWMQKAGLEWFFRLITEPRRLGKRYLINNPTFIVLVTAQLLKIRRYSLE